jgi:hypothetical protein
MEMSQSDDLTSLYYVCDFLHIPPSEARTLSQEDFHLTAGFAIRKRKEMLQMRGLL